MAASVDQKKVDEKHIKEIRDFQKTSTANRRCFDCNEMGPQYICLDFNTFICTACSGLHREFSHRIKSISMSTFTDTEVKNIVKFGGNEAAHKFWLARFDVNSQPSSNLNSRDRIRNFIRDVYVDRRWVFEEPKPKAEPVKAEVKKPSPLLATAAAPIDFNPFQIAPPASATPSPAVAFGDFSSFDKQQQPAASAVDFADFSAFDAHQASSAQAVGFADFDSFNSSSSIDFFTSPTAAAAAAASLSSRSAPPAFEPFGEPLQATPSVDPFFAAPFGSPPPAMHKPVASDNIFADFDAATTIHDPFQAFTSPSPSSSASFPSSSVQPATASTTSKAPPLDDPFASFEAPIQPKPSNKPTDNSTNLDPFNAFDTLTPLTSLQPPTTTPALALDLWGQPPPPSSSKSQPHGHALGGIYHGLKPPTTPFDSTNYSTNQGSSNPAFSSNVSSFVNKEQKALAVDPFASLDIGIKRSSAATTTHATPFHGQPTSSFSHHFQSNSTGVPVNQQHTNPYYSTNQPTVAYHPNNIVVAPVTQKPASSNPFDMF
ncbi:hypothetical protein H257_11538 [Aphanomyces astaci]|uniref:Arf-GAP domain-containing protein n=1 Tax=Aphanomyces astaci TaxID=112090 RepID=W4G3L7_APHAT|nr:hypothetical protein H257_11538 [Aphanomyces astaci]ETV73881.1 hypothetical protein H257_11538 [Aphanomyces astaci]|eukprot:XP_009836817.1 hypothetical protein H257_11538 [Aphanomyces astaci]